MSARGRRRREVLESEERGARERSNRTEGGFLGSKRAQTSGTVHCEPLSLDTIKSFHLFRREGFE